MDSSIKEKKTEKCSRSVKTWFEFAVLVNSRHVFPGPQAILQSWKKAGLCCYWDVVGIGAACDGVRGVKAMLAL